MTRGRSRIFRSALLFFLFDFLLGLFFLGRLRRFLLLGLLAVLAFAHDVAPLPFGLPSPVWHEVIIPLIGAGHRFIPLERAPTPAPAPNSPSHPPVAPRNERESASQPPDIAVMPNVTDYLKASARSADELPGFPSLLQALTSATPSQALWHTSCEPPTWLPGPVQPASLPLSANRPGI